MVLIFCLFVLCIINAFYTSELQFLQRHAGHDTDRTVLSCLVWRCELGIIQLDARLSESDGSLPPGL